MGALFYVARVARETTARVRAVVFLCRARRRDTSARVRERSPRPPPHDRLPARQAAILAGGSKNGDSAAQQKVCPARPLGCPLTRPVGALFIAQRTPTGDFGNAGSTGGKAHGTAWLPYYTPCNAVHRSLV
jgi:hypothetical protein